MSKKYFVTGTDTDVGKTVVSAILVEALKSCYFKPIQSGDLHHTDSHKIIELTSLKLEDVFPENYALTFPASPHYSADRDGVKIELKNFKLPTTKKNLIVEGAGGVLVPLNETDLVIDLISKFDLETILVSKNYLGSINHTLLTIEALKNRNIKIKGIIFNGEPNSSTEDYILNFTGINYLGRLFPEKEVTKDVVSKYAKQFQFLNT